MPGLRYPIFDEDRLLRSKIVFQPFKVDPPEFESTGLFAKQTWQAISGSDPDVARESIKTLKASPISSLQISPLGPSCSLYLPVSHNVNESLNYDTSTALNISGAAAASAANRGAESMVGAVAAGITSGFESLTQFFGGGATGVAARIAAARLASTPLGLLVPEGLRNAIGLVGRVTVNPNIRTTFNGVVIREFQFQFKFLPRSAEESAEVKKIIKLFRLRAFPREIGDDFPVGFEYPEIFKIRLLSGKEGEYKHVGTPIKFSYLRNIQTIYNPTSQTFHPDGSPTEIDLNLSFVEYKTISKKDIENEDNDAFYDYYGATEETGMFSDGFGGGD